MQASMHMYSCVLDMHNIWSQSDSLYEMLLLLHLHYCQPNASCIQIHMACMSHLYILSVIALS